MTIKRDSPPICSECGKLLPRQAQAIFHRKESEKGDTNMRKCINPSCNYITDIAARIIEDHKHNEFHEIGKDECGYYDHQTGKWASFKK